MASSHSEMRPLNPRQWIIPNISRESLEVQAELASPRRPTGYLFLAGLEFFHVPRSEHELATKRACFGRKDPDKKISWERDWEGKID